jgi:hypothetical protein
MPSNSDQMRRFINLLEHAVPSRQQILQADENPATQADHNKGSILKELAAYNLTRTVRRPRVR